MNPISKPCKNLVTNNFNCIFEELFVNEFSLKTYNGKLMIIINERLQSDILPTTKAKN